MDTVVSTVDANGWCWVLVAVGCEQADRCSDNRGTEPSATVCAWRILVSATTEIASVMG